jgi:hypothetical protein
MFNANRARQVQRRRSRHPGSGSLTAGRGRVRVPRLDPGRRVGSLTDVGWATGRARSQPPRPAGPSSSCRPPSLRGRARQQASQHRPRRPPRPRRQVVASTGHRSSRPGPLRRTTTSHSIGRHRRRQRVGWSPPAQWERRPHRCRLVRPAPAGEPVAPARAPSGEHGPRTRFRHGGCAAPRMTAP